MAGETKTVTSQCKLHKGHDAIRNYDAYRVDFSASIFDTVCFYKHSFLSRFAIFINFTLHRRLCIDMKSFVQEIRSSLIRNYCLPKMTSQYSGCLSLENSCIRRCFAIVTNERALLSKLGQPVRKVIQTPYCVFQAGKQTFKDRPICAIIWCIVNIGNGYELNNNKGKTD